MFTETGAQEAEAKKHVSRGEFFVLCSKPAASQHGALFPEKPDTLCRLMVPGARTVSDFMDGDRIGSGILQEGLTLLGTG